MPDKTSLIIIDDDPVFLSMLESGLSMDGYHCETSTSASSALDYIRENSFDIMITDISMPEIRGFELTEQAKKLRPDMAVIIMTGFIDEFSYDKAIEAGASDFIKKPFTLKELIARIEHVKMNERIRTMSFTDELTGLYNRRGFFTLIEHLLKMAKRQDKGLFMLYSDLDNLKVINDTWGHRVGDMALIDIAQILKENFRESDIIARIGGDEFVVMPVGTDGDDMTAILVRLQNAIDIHNLQNTRDYAISVSTGISYYDPKFPVSVDKLLAQADTSMYEQKRNRKNS
jgi:two-component system, cell cycle response regulator